MWFDCNNLKFRTFIKSTYQLKKKNLVPPKKVPSNSLNCCSSEAKYESFEERQMGPKFWAGKCISVGDGVLVCIYVLHVSHVVSCTYARTTLIKLHKIVLFNLHTRGICTDIFELVFTLYNAFVGDRIALMTTILQNRSNRSYSEVA